ncbi:MAG: Gfo/Idh/MocA family oxidoreductase [Chloroflexi bacterium]|nr:Gfo/Idh/MocA family oxidoreductase [Chloroflexota bacterium]
MEIKKLRHAIIGVGALVFNMHRPALDLPTTEVAAVCDIRTEIGKQRADELGVPFYEDYRQMLAEVQPDVTVVMTPHYLHPQMAIDAMKAGSHVLVEKPMATQVADADRMVAVARETGKLLAVNFQQRLRPEVLAARRLIEAGRVGTIQRVSLVVPWPRSYRYYSLASWRATWWGEGGGVLLNQAPHDLDLVCHLAGMPRRVISWNRANLHQIEVEDTISAMLEWDNGASGYLHISTAESGPKSDLEVVGTKGSIQVKNGALAFHEFEADVHEFLRTTDEIYSGPGQKPVPVELETGEGAPAGDHPSVYRNFHAAILTGSPISASGEQGVMSLELANAMIYSSFTQSVVELPLDRQKYSELLESLKMKSKAAG